MTRTMSLFPLGQTVRNLIPEATRLSNYLGSRKRPVEESELRAAARHFSEDIGLEGGSVYLLCYVFNSEHFDGISCEFIM